MQFDIILLEYTFLGLSCLPLWLLASLGAFLLGWLLDWLLSGRRQASISREWENKYNAEHQRFVNLEKDFATLKYEYDEVEAKMKVVKNNLQICEADKQILKTKLGNLEAGGAAAGGVLATGGDSGKALEALQAKYASLEANFNTVQESLKRCEADNLALSSKLNVSGTGTTNPTIEIAAETARDISSSSIENSGIGGGLQTGSVNTGEIIELSYGDIFQEDNLQICEGIGPKIEGLLKTDGINTWKDLGAAKYETLAGILEKAGPRFKMHDPGSWSKQANFAAKGEWKDLIAYQRELSGGMIVEGKSSPSKIEKMGMKILGFSNDPEDLKIIEGIGPKIEALLKADGINTWAELGASNLDRLKDILGKAGERYRLADPTTWAKQADLAANGKWKDLSEYQDYLDGGKEPGK